MSTAERLRWLAHEVHRGRECCVAFSFNAANQREKIKFSLTDSYVCATVYRPCLLGALHSAQFAVECSISTDKGHKSSDGCTVVQFWLKQPSTHDTAAEDKTHMGQVAAMDAPGHRAMAAPTAIPHAPAGVQMLRPTALILRQSHHSISE